MRLLVPAALVAFAVLFLVVIVGSLVGASSTSTGTEEGERAAPEPGAGSDRGRMRGPRAYTVRRGDTLGSIAERTGRSPEELQELNAGLDAQTLQPGQRLKLRE